LKNPYKPPSLPKKRKKYKEPIIDVSGLFFVFSLYLAIGCTIIILEYLAGLVE